MGRPEGRKTQPRSPLTPQNLGFQSRAPGMGSGTRGATSPQSFRQKSVPQQPKGIHFWNVHGLFLPFLLLQAGKGWKEEWLQILKVGKENAAGSSSSGVREISWLPRDPDLWESKDLSRGQASQIVPGTPWLETPSGPSWCPSFHRNLSMQNPDFSGMKPLREAGQPHLGCSSPQEPPGWSSQTPAAPPCFHLSPGEGIPSL